MTTKLLAFSTLQKKWHISSHTLTISIWLLLFITTQIFTYTFFWNLSIARPALLLCILTTACIIIIYHIIKKDSFISLPWLAWLLWLTANQYLAGRLYDSHYQCCIITGLIFLLSCTLTREKIRLVFIRTSWLSIACVIAPVIYFLVTGDGQNSFNPFSSGHLHSAIALNCAALFPILIAGYAYTSSSHKKYLLCIGVVFLITIFLSSSRTAFVMIGTQILILLIAFFKQKKYRIPLFASCFVCLSFIVWLGIQKTDSTFGRTFIWKIAWPHIFQESGLIGKGMGRFSIDYLSWQASYFINNGTNNHEAFIASDTQMCFNEYLQLLYETGWIGLSLLLLLVVVIPAWLLLKGKNSLSAIIACAGLCSILIAACMHYTLHIFFILSLLCLYTGIIYTEKRNYIVSLLLIGKRLKMFVLAPAISILFVGIGCLLFQFLKGNIYWNKARQYEQLKPYQAISTYAEAHHLLYYSPAFLTDYGRFLQQDGWTKNAFDIYVALNKQYIHSKNFIQLGMMAQTLEQYPWVPLFYSYAHYLHPVKLLPFYALGNLYQLTGLHSIALRYYNHVLFADPKKRNTQYAILIAKTKEQVSRLTNSP